MQKEHNRTDKKTQDTAEIDVQNWKETGTQDRVNLTDYVIEREFLGSITTAELLSRIIRAHLSDFPCQETVTP